MTVDITEDATPIFETFPDEQLRHIAHNPAPCFVDIVNYLITSQMLMHWGQQDKSYGQNTKECAKSKFESNPILTPI
jgi:catalase